MSPLLRSSELIVMSLGYSLSWPPCCCCFHCCCCCCVRLPWSAKTIHKTAVVAGLAMHERVVPGQSGATQQRMKSNIRTHTLSSLFPPLQPHLARTRLSFGRSSDAHKCAMWRLLFSCSGDESSVGAESGSLCYHDLE